MLQSKQSKAAERSHSNIPVTSFASVFKAHCCWTSVRADIMLSITLSLAGIWTLGPPWTGYKKQMTYQCVTVLLLPLIHCYLLKIKLWLSIFWQILTSISAFYLDTISWKKTFENIGINLVKINGTAFKVECHFDRKKI